MKKFLFLPLLLVVLLASGCSLTKQAKTSVEVNNLDGINQPVEVVSEPVSEPVPEVVPVSEVVPEAITEPIPDSMADNPAGSTIVCAPDTQSCSNGSVVGRVAPDCQFEPCPGE